MFETAYIIAVISQPVLWSVVIFIALLLPLLPLSIIRYINVRDTRAEQIERRFLLSSAQTRTAEKVVLLTVAGWPSMREVVYEDASTAATSVGFEFKATTIAHDIAGALGSRGIEVLTLDLVEVESFDELGQADLAVVVYPARHGQLPWQLLAFFDRVVEPGVAAHQPGMNRIPLATMALGDKAIDVQTSQTHIEQMQQRYGFTMLSNSGIINVSDRLLLYEQTLDFADDVLAMQSQLADASEAVR